MPASRPIPIVLNASAGALKATAGVEALQEMAQKAGVEAQVLGSESPEDMAETVSRLVRDGADRIGIAGGDGTVSRVVPLLAHTTTAMGIIPQGTFNNFATALRLPADVPSALKLLKDGRPVPVSLGKVGEAYFTEAAGVGLFADALAIYGGQSNKNFFKAFFAIARVFFSMRSRRMRLVLDGEPLYQRAVWCTVANTYRMAQGLAIAPEANLTDDVLDVVVVGDLARLEFVRYYRAIRAQTHTSLPKVSIHKVKSIRIEAHDVASVHADDRVVAHTPVEIRIDPGALRVIL